MRFLFCILSAAAWCGAAEPAKQPAPAGRPQLVVVDPVVEFGKRSEGTLLTKVFTLKNTGSDTLKIETVRKCSCITIDLPERSIPPGEKIHLQATVNFANLEGMLTKSIFLKTNDPTVPVHSMRFTGEVFRHVKVTPSGMFFPMPRRKYRLVRYVQVEMNGDRPIKITGVEEPGEPFSHLLKEVTPGKLYQLTLMCSGISGETDVAEGELVLLTDHPDKPKVNIPLSARLIPPIYVTPAKLRLTRGSSGSVYLHVRGGSVKNFKLLKVELPEPGAAAQILKIPGASGGYRVRISSLLADDSLKDAKVVLVTDAETAKRIEIPIEVFE